MAKAEKSVSKKSSESKRQEAIGEDGRTRYSKDAERTLLREGDPVSRRELRDDPGSEFLKFIFARSTKRKEDVLRRVIVGGL